MGLLDNPNELLELKNEMKEQLFTCERYHCVMTKYACHARRLVIGKAKVNDTGKHKPLVISEEEIQNLRYSRCFDCTQSWPDDSVTSTRILAQEAAINVSLGKVYKKRASTKPVVSHCPKCNRAITATRKFNYKKDQCSSCTSRDYARAKQAEKVAARPPKPVKIKSKETYRLCNHHDTCSANHLCRHAKPHKHGHGDKLRMLCRTINACIVCVKIEEEINDGKVVLGDS